MMFKLQTSEIASPEGTVLYLVHMFIEHNYKTTAAFSSPQERSNFIQDFAANAPQED